MFYPHSQLLLLPESDPKKEMHIRATKTTCLLACLILLQTSVFSQGRVVINEFMPWSGCNTTSEFIELLNFGPGPMNIGCYIVTNGKYSVTIPPNTILQPGQFYLISGQDALYKNCSATDSPIPVNLNWNTCGCTNAPVPTTGDGFMKDGGNSNEKIVLLSPTLSVIDAVSRSSSPSASVAITTPAFSGGCPGTTFNLDAMNINYEAIGISTGIDNSFARKVDGDCGWVKTTAISPVGPNKTGSTSSATYSFNTLSASECKGTTGSISIGVSSSDVSSIFPMSYTLAFDKDSNSIFNAYDQYTNGVDSVPSYIDINNMMYGRYRITVASSSGCNLKSYDFYIFNCYGVVLPVNLVSFKYLGIRENQQWFSCEIENRESLQSLALEGGDSTGYKAVTEITSFGSNSTGSIILKAPVSSYKQYRLRMTNKLGVISYSAIININTTTTAGKQLWPNPATDKLSVQLPSDYSGKAQYSITNSMGTTIRQGTTELIKGALISPLNISNLRQGIYFLQVSTGSQPISFRFVKH